jgi:DNA (cytosine-5)-methyltransferase 3A
MRLNVLSLFDGISCGQIALERAGLEVDNYFASEIDKFALQVAKHNYPNTKHLGDVMQVKGSELPKINLLIGGSPCQGFSFAGKQLNFKDPRSKLFFEFVRLLKETKPKYFLLENVKMKKEYQDVISQHLGITPVEINSSSFSMQNRRRLYWTNIPILQFDNVSKDCFDGYLYRLGHGYIKDEIKFFKKYPALAAQSPATKYRIVLDLQKANDALKSNSLNLLRRGSILTRSATPEECEKFQTLPDGYTATLKKGQRYKCIGNGWTVDVIAHIFKGLLLERRIL